MLAGLRAGGYLPDEVYRGAGIGVDPGEEASGGGRREGLLRVDVCAWYSSRSSLSLLRLRWRLLVDIWLENRMSEGRREDGEIRM